MDQTRKYFTQDELLSRIRESFIAGLKAQGIEEVSRSLFTNLDCLMSGLAVFTFKFSSLLKFDKARGEEDVLRHNLRTLFGVESAPCDTHMRERLDEITPRVFRPAFSNLFQLLQRNKIL